MSNPTVAIVDDDPAICDSVRLLLETADFGAETFGSAQGLLGRFEPSKFCCIVADVRMPDMDGIALLSALSDRGSSVPVVIITGFADVPLAVRAMKAGAADFIEKPFDDDSLLESVRRVVSRAAPDESLAEDQARLAALTARERQVLECLVIGQSNKVMAHQLGISPRTIEIHRAHVMEKMRVRHLSELVRLAVRLGVH